MQEQDRIIKINIEEEMCIINICLNARTRQNYKN